MTPQTRHELFASAAASPAPLAILADAPPAISKPQRSCPASGAASGRRRLWEVSTMHHCVLLGAAFDARELRQMFRRARYAGWEDATDYHLHSSAVSLAANANEFSREVQRRLDERYEAVVAVFRAAASALQLMQTWGEWVERGEVVAAYWAAVTHPLCDAVASETLSQEMHMAAHTAFIANRALQRRLRTAQEANSALDAQLGRLREQCRASRSEAAKLKEALPAARAQAHALQANIEALTRELARWRNGDELQQWRSRCESLAQEHAAATARIAAEQRTVAKLTAQIERLQERTVRIAQEQAAAANADVVATPVTEASVPDLAHACVLCVGGRASLVPKYRALIGRARADFLYHDGGLEDHLGRLPALLGSAHAVVCFSGEVSHAAYRTVKRYCKLRGKPCALIEQPSINGLLRALAAIRDRLLAASAVPER